jgi:hypothetical protein
MTAGTRESIERGRRRVWRCALLLAALVALPESGLAGGDAIRCERLSGRIEARNGHAWNYGFDVCRADDAVTVSVGIHLIPAGGVALAEIDAVKGAWKRGIEAIWSGKTALLAADGTRLPILVNVDFDGRSPHHEIVVRRGGDRNDSLNWSLRNDGRIVAHEFGHLLGAYDEYAGGATATAEASYDPGSVMNHEPGGTLTREAHFAKVLDHCRRNGEADVSLYQTDGMEMRHD